MSFFISGASATFFYSYEAYPTRISVPFFQRLKHSSQCSQSLVPITVTTATSIGAFTTVLDALVDSLCEQDVVLGIDWINSCASNNILSKIELPPAYSSSEFLGVKLWFLSYIQFHLSIVTFLFTRSFCSSFMFVFCFSFQFWY
jgi:hypothetical protein